MDVSAQTERQRFTLLPFCSSQALKLRMMFNLIGEVQMLISFLDPLRNIPRNNVSPVIWASLSPV